MAGRMLVGVQGLNNAPLSPGALERMARAPLDVCRAEIGREASDARVAEILAGFRSRALRPLVLLEGGAVSAGNAAVATHGRRVHRLAREVDVVPAGFECGNEPRIGIVKPLDWADHCLRIHDGLRADSWAGPVVGGSVNNTYDECLDFMRSMRWDRLPSTLSPGIHSYTKDNTLTTGHHGTIDRDLQLAIEACAGRVPWVTEFGWHVGPQKKLWKIFPRPRLTNDQVSAALSRMLARLEALGVPCAVVYQWICGTDRSNYLDWYGLCDENGGPKVQYAAVSFYARASRPSGQPPAPPPVPPPSPRPVPPPQPPPAPVPAPPGDRFCRVSVFAAAGGFAPITGGTLTFDDPTWPVLAGVLEDGRLRFALPAAAVYGWGVSLTAKAAEQTAAWRVTLAPDIDVAMPPLVTARKGLPRLSGHTWSDEDGAFYPLGTTLFWAVGGRLRGDGDRVKRHGAFIKQQKVDYARILCQVNWAGEEIDPDHPQYDNALAWTIDALYDEGIRSALTLIGGGCRSPLDLARKVLAVVAERRHKVMDLEAVNEGNAPEADAVDVAKRLATAGIPFGVGFGNQGIDALKRVGDAAGASLDFYHQERGEDETGTRQVRQVWDAKEFPRAPVWREPPGPASSVEELTDPLKLALMRAGAIICGAESYVLHFGAGVFGRAHTSSNGKVRQANLWEVPSVEAIFAAVRAADRHLPAGIGNWTKYNDGWTSPLPTAPVSIGGAFKHYGARSAGQFASVAIGCVGTVTLKAQERCHVAVVNAATGATVLEADLERGESRPLAGLWGYVLIGTVR